MVQELLILFDRLMSYGDSETIKNTIVLLSFTLSVILVFLYFQIKRMSEEIIKFVGCFIIVTLSLLANNEWVYAIAIFIIATLITSLEYLENLAAIITRNENFWTYRQRQKDLSRMSAASEKEIEEKIQDEIPTAPILRETRLNQDDIQIKAREYEERVLLDIEKLGIFDKDSFQKERRIGIDGRHYILDAVGIRLGRHISSYYIIEVKYIKYQNKLLKQGINQVLWFCYAFQKYLQNTSIPVYGLLIIPSSMNSQDIFGDKIGILKYDIENSIFVNKDIILDWIEKNDWKK